jgi:hypothetical protein
MGIRVKIFTKKTLAITLKCVRIAESWEVNLMYHFPLASRRMQLLTEGT